MDHRYIALALCSVAAAGVATAEIVPLAQTRSVDAYAFASSPTGEDEHSEDDAAPDFGPWTGAAGASAVSGEAFANAAAEQTSQILPAMLTATGSVGGAAEGWDFKSFADSDAESLFDLTFVVSFPSTFSLSGTLGVFDSGSASVMLSGPGGMPIYTNFGGFNEEIPFSTGGALSGGQYQLIARTRANLFGSEGFPDYGSGSYDVVLTVESTVAAEETLEPSVTTLRVWPNPARGVVHIDGIGVDDLAVFDAAGRRVRSLSTVTGRAVWDVRDGNGRRVSPGVYFVRPNDVTGSASRVLITD